MTCENCVYFGHDFTGNTPGWCALLAVDMKQEAAPCEGFDRRCD